MADYYEAPTQKSLERGYYWMTHRKMYQRIAIILVVLIILSIILVSVFNLFKYFSKPSFEDQARILATPRHWSLFHQSNAPEDLLVLDARALNIGVGLYDLTAIVENVNDDWAITEITYHFVVNKTTLNSQTTFFNPGEDKILLSPGYKSSRPVASLELVIDDVKWRRSDDQAMVVDWRIEDVKYKATSREKDGNQSFTVPPSVTWKVTNNSLYDFWEVDFQVSLYNANTLVGVREWKENYFDALETKELEVIWLNDLPRVTEAKVHPILNLLDRDNLRDVEADIFR